MLRRLAVDATPARRGLATLAPQSSLYDALQRRWSKEEATQPSPTSLPALPTMPALPKTDVLATISASLRGAEPLHAALTTALTSHVDMPNALTKAVLDAVPTTATTLDDRRRLLRVLVSLATQQQCTAPGLLAQCMHMKAYDEALRLYTHGCYDSEIPPGMATVLFHMHALTEFAPALPATLSLPKTWKLFVSYFVYRKKALAPSIAHVLIKQFPFCGSPTPSVLSMVALDLIESSEKDQFKLVHDLVRCVLRRADWRLSPDVFTTWLYNEGHRRHHARLLPLLLDALAHDKLTHTPPNVIITGVRSSLLLCDWALVARFQHLLTPTSAKVVFLLSAGESLVTPAVAAFCLRPPHAISADGIAEWALALPTPSLRAQFAELFGPKLMVLVGADEASALALLHLAAATEASTFGDMLDIYLEACQRAGTSTTGALTLAATHKRLFKDVPPQLLVASLAAGDFELATDLFEHAESKHMDNPRHAHALEALLRASSSSQRDAIHAYFLAHDTSKAMAVFEIFEASDLVVPASLLRHFALDVTRAHDMVSLNRLLEYGVLHEVALPADVFTVCFVTHRKELQDPTGFVTAFLQWVALGLVEDNAIVYHAAIHACLDCNNIDLAWTCVEEADAHGIVLEKVILDRLVWATDNS
ncbi:hypothetical protein SPRG_06454 [Saprolegnia parasitica CBS 223.65]|uniref:Uncharacterized protein n=1 Tax=Saprolegnia parasitica (strain CBS 223.65) TaxID=695850 RepID=A0A067CDM7_SAPPC|nr:hypothetical protein SPRG_06454 [Saprolegnia parasitica CBS 223.65]KDO28598.1 hypothetical protein SPRG_06454 [Saprolegnia parasitica CBS 223.65]|eukprot:XP_012200661.1 hypothetical protein SPRG_06454 [Saprolegnia parasitica CBS 223.65]